MKVYLCSSLRPEVVARVDQIIKSDQFSHVEFFLPRGTDISLRAKCVKEDVAAIEDCDEFWVMGEYGRDCSWEIGFAMGIGKKVKIFADETNEARLDADWMYRIGFDRQLLEVVYL